MTAEVKTPEELVREVRHILKFLIARGRIAGPGLHDKEELESVAMFAAAQALRCYDPSKGILFSTYLFATIRHECHRFMLLYSVSPECRRRKRRANQVSLSRPVRRGRRARTLADFVGKDLRRKPSMLTIREGDRERFWIEAVRRIPGEHAPIFLARFRDDLTCEECGAVFGVSGHRIQQIVRGCMEKLRNDPTLGKRLELIGGAQ